MSLENFFRQALSRWMEYDGAHSAVVVSSRMRLARNLGDYPFPGRASRSQLEEIEAKLHRWWNQGGLKSLGETKFIALSKQAPTESLALVDKHLISPVMARSLGAVILNESESVSIMINEEDHLRIQILLPGLQLNEAWQQASAIDDLFDAGFRYAWSPDLGYLTNCPTNVGTGMRASVMLHLPGLALAGQLNQVVAAISKLGFAVRGLYGEGSEAQGNLFQVSNQVTLGQTEDRITEALNRIALQIIRQELDIRQQLLEKQNSVLSDRVWRAYGILSHARSIESREAMELLSSLRLGIDTGLIKDLSPGIFDELLVFIRAGYLQKIFGRELAAQERDSCRAELIRERIKKNS